MASRETLSHIGRAPEHQKPSTEDRKELITKKIRFYLRTRCGRKEKEKEKKNEVHYRYNLSSIMYGR